ncbi:hypothetical protein LSTR_LSTR004496 [Laodelphax striatellus]|uniref:G-protein coupled receptors family 1 profile domain-containing protein n=1 Tax=Laodelphax striatellus TaxID=195883 RepID=A0A482XHS5_LAOST|nr:hypothetical protein LSTR_LSTR004496 [Laodelphax striatellus]
MTGSGSILESIQEITSKSNWIVWAFLIVLVIGGVLTNAILSIGLAKRRILPICLHLAIADICVLLFLAPYEILILADGTGIWNFPDNYCPVFLGAETLLGTVVVYLLVLQNFSTLAVDRMSFKLMLMIVWLIALLLSIPQFLYSSVIPLTAVYRVCYVPKYATMLVAIFRAFIPTSLLLVTLVFILLRYKELTKTKYPSQVKYSVVMSAVYLTISVNRPIFLLIFRLNLPKFWLDTYRIPPLAEIAESSSFTLTLCSLHYTLSALRPFFCWFLCTKVLPPKQDSLIEMSTINSNTYYSYPI